MIHHQIASAQPIYPPQPKQELTVLTGHGEQNGTHVPCQTIVPGAQVSLEVVILTLLVPWGTRAALPAHQHSLQMPSSSSTILPPGVLILTPSVVQIFWGIWSEETVGRWVLLSPLGWGTASILSSFCFVLKEKKKKLSVDSHEIQTHSLKTATCTKSLAFKPQQPDVLHLLFQPLSHFPGQHLYTGLPLLYWDSATHSQSCPLPEDPQMAWPPCTAVLPVMPTQRNLFIRASPQLKTYWSILHYGKDWEGPMQNAAAQQRTGLIYHT